MISKSITQNVGCSLDHSQRQHRALLPTTARKDEGGRSLRRSLAQGGETALRANDLEDFTCATAPVPFFRHRYSRNNPSSTQGTSTLFDSLLSRSPALDQIVTVSIWPRVVVVVRCLLTWTCADDQPRLDPSGRICYLPPLLRDWRALSSRRRLHPPGRAR
jgi:hypothetical protein